MVPICAYVCVCVVLRVRREGEGPRHVCAYVCVCCSAHLYDHGPKHAWVLLLLFIFERFAERPCFVHHELVQSSLCHTGYYPHCRQEVHSEYPNLLAPLISQADSTGIDCLQPLRI